MSGHLTGSSGCVKPQSGREGQNAASGMLLSTFVRAFPGEAGDSTAFQGLQQEELERSHLELLLFLVQ